MKTHFVSLLAVLVLIATSCRPAVPAPGSQLLPPGDPAQGKASFVALKCHVCHTVAGMDFPPPTASPPVPVVLGRESQPPTRSQIIESIIKPSHSLEPGYKEELIRSGRLSRMGDYSEAMTVRQLVDLVAFLESLHQGR